MKSILPVLIFIAFSAHAAVPPSKPAMTTNHLIEILSLPAKNREAALKTLPESSYKNLVQMAFDYKWSMGIRWQALTTAANLKKENSTQDMIRATKSSEWFMRSAGLLSLKEVNPEMAELTARSLIKDKALVVRSAAVDVLKSQMKKESRPLFWSELDANYNFKKKQSLWIRPQLVAALAERPKDEELPQFVKILMKDSDSQVRWQAVQGLEKITGLKLAQGDQSEAKVVQLWQEHFKNSPFSESRK